MIVEFGAFALSLLVVLSGLQAALSFAGRARGSRLLAGAGEGAAIAAAAACLIAFAALVWAFANSDFSVLNVALNSRTDKPFLYKVAAAWGSHEGSMLLWCLMLTGFGAAVVMAGRNLPETLRALVVGVQGVLGFAFTAYAALASTPFARVAPVPVEGRSLNPLLQDPFLAIHPPFLYAGYVGFSVVFSFAVAALIDGRVDTAWARWVRPWTLAAWSLLTVGITLGAYWAYYELGWGGWWFWDPVENASFLPWLAGAALLHSAVVTERRGALAGWTVFLALIAFTFSMLGAFLVRSGVLTSVHAFAVDPTRGVLLLGILGVTAGAGFALFAWRGSALTSQGAFAPISRESSLVLNNLILSASAATVLLGTLYPLIVEGITGDAVSVGPPYFNATFGPLMAVLLLLVPFGPMLAWKRGDAPAAVKRLWIAAAAAVAAGLCAAALTSRSAAPALAAGGAGLAAWLIVGAILEPLERARFGRVPLSEAVRRLRSLPLGGWGTTLAHAGLGVFVLGACVELAAKSEAAEVLRPGDSLTVGERRLTLAEVAAVNGPNYLAERGVFVVDGGARVVSERRLYPAGGQTTSEVGLLGQGLGELYVVFGERRATPAGPGWLVRVYGNPFVRLIFAGPILMALGGALSLADRRLRIAAPASRRAPKPATVPAE